MKTLEISYNPYKIQTKMVIDGIDVCTERHYDKFKEFIENRIPLQTWIEPIPYLDWNGLVNEVSDPEINDEVQIIFSGRKIDFEDLKRSITKQNKNRAIGTQVKYHFQHPKKLDDRVLSHNIDEVVEDLMSDRFRELVEHRTTEGLRQKYNALAENYKIAKETEFYIILAGVYSAGKSTLLNTLIRHDILPTSSKTCTSKNCRIRHDRSLGHRVTLSCYDADNKLVGEKKVFDNDPDCAAAFSEICPIRDNGVNDEHPEIAMMELGVDLSHLYPDSVKDDKFTIVLIDTPGMDSAQSSDNGINKHAEIALNAISMESKPMIVLCVDGQKYEDISIGEFMREIVKQSEKDGSGFNDRFMFVMNKSDVISYKQNESIEDVKTAFARYLTDNSKWNVQGDDDELRQFTESASHFVPRIFMTAARPALAIQQKAFDFTNDELDSDKDKEDLLDKYEDFEKKICKRKRTDYYLSNYCDIPSYRKEEIQGEFDLALVAHDHIRATQLQCGLVAVEYAIMDYIERYAYPVKVRGLLETFEDILEDVDGFTNGVLADLTQAEAELGEKESERKEVSRRKESVEEKIAALESAKRNINIQWLRLNEMKFDSITLGKVVSEFRADIEADDEIIYLRQHPKVETGQKSRNEVEDEIKERVSHIKELFDVKLHKTNQQLEKIKEAHDQQLLRIFEFLKDTVKELEKSGAFQHGEYKFTDSVLWKMNFADINTDGFASVMINEVVDKSTTTKEVCNYRKIEWSTSRNPFKKIGSWFMEDFQTITVDVDGYYDTTIIRQSIAAYLHNLQIDSKNMEIVFKDVMEDSKRKVGNLIQKLLTELSKFLDDIKIQEERIELISGSMKELGKEIEQIQATHKWLRELKDKIEGV